MAGMHATGTTPITNGTGSTDVMRGAASDDLGVHDGMLEAEHGVVVGSMHADLRKLTSMGTMDELHTHPRPAGRARA